MEKLKEVTRFGQSLWLAFLRRALIESGELRRLLDSGVQGITADITTTAMAVSNSADYDQLLQRLLNQGTPAEQVREMLLIDDAQRAADFLHQIYENTEGNDGYVSVPLDPALAHDAVGLVGAARRLGGLCGRIDRPNSMIEVPATEAGITALQELIADGCNVNVGQIFSLDVYRRVLAAYLDGLDSFFASHSVWRLAPAAVASFPLAPLDAAVDAALERLGQRRLQGKCGIAVARLAYEHFRQVSASPRWQRLLEQGARAQRLLWRDTNPYSFAYPRSYYAEALVGAETVHAVNGATLSELQTGVVPAATLSEGVDEARAALAQLAEVGVALETIGAGLQTERIEAERRTYRELVSQVRRKRDDLEAGWRPARVFAGPFAVALDAAVKRTCAEDVMCRLWLADQSLWPPGPGQEQAPLGWLHLPEVMAANCGRLEALQQEIVEQGYRKAVVVGSRAMQEAARLFGDTFGQIPALPGVVPYRYEERLPLHVLAEADEQAVQELTAGPELAQTLFILDGGGRGDGNGAFGQIYQRVAARESGEGAARQFVAVAESSSELAEMADERGFRALFLTDPQSPGSFGVLGYSGLVPAVVAGVDVSALIERACQMAVNASGCNCPIEGDNLAGRLGSILAALANQQGQQITLFPSQALWPLGRWVGRFLAESSQGELRPRVHEGASPPLPVDRNHLLVSLSLDGDDEHRKAVQATRSERTAVVEIRLKDLYDLGSQLFLWQVASVVTAHQLQLNPFPTEGAARRRSVAMTA